MSIKDYIGKRKPPLQSNADLQAAYNSPLGVAINTLDKMIFMVEDRLDTETDATKRTALEEQLSMMKGEWGSIYHMGDTEQLNLIDKIAKEYAPDVQANFQKIVQNCKNMERLKDFFENC